MDRFSHTKIDTYINCPMKFYRRYIQRIVPIKKAKPLALGSCMAAGLAAFRNPETALAGLIKEASAMKNSPEGIQETLGALSPAELAEDAFMKTWAEEERVLELVRENDPLRSIPRALEILSEYCKTYVDDAEIFIQPEIVFKEEIAPGIFFEGRIDGVVKLADNQGIAIDEDKTASRLGDFYFKQLRSSYQVLWYLWIAKHLKLFEIYGSQKPMLLMNVVYIHAKNFRFEQQLAIKTNREVDASYQDLLMWIKQIQWAIETNHFPQANSEICLKYGGCEYLPLRNASESIRETLIKTNYRPYLSREEEEKKRAEKRQKALEETQ